jgi:hypothetical protein
MFRRVLDLYYPNFKICFMLTILLILLLLSMMLSSTICYLLDVYPCDTHTIFIELFLIIGVL